MKTVDLEEATLESAVDAAQNERLVLRRDGKAVALLVGIDEEQATLGASKAFWNLIAARRKERTISRAELEQRLSRGG